MRDRARRRGPALLTLLVLMAAAWLAGPGPARAQGVGADQGEGVSGLALAGVRLEPDRSPRDSGFELFTARVALDGSVAPGIEYRFQAGAGDDLSGVELLDARLTLPLDPRARLSLGQFKAPFSEEALRDRGEIRFVERSQAVSELAPGRQVGLELAGAFLEERLTYRAGVFNGDGRTSRNPGGGFLWTGRVAYNSVGPAQFYDELVVQVGVSAAASSDSITASGVVPPGAPGTPPAGNGERAAFVGDRLLLGADARLSYRGAFLQGEYLRGEFRADSRERIGEGWYAEAGYSVMRALDLLARWDSYRPPGGERRAFVVLGANLWIGMESRLGFHLALQADGPSLPATSGELPGRAVDVPGGLADGQAVIRLQAGF